MYVFKKASALFESLFQLKANATTVRQEILAGITTFSTLAYAIVLLPSMLSATGMPFESVMMATMLSAAFATLMMGFYASYPFVLAPGLALCAYFTYSVVLQQNHSWETALGAVFLCGLLFFCLNLLRIRQLIIEVIPQTLRIATTAGIGMFLAFIGCKNAGILIGDPHTLIAFGNPSSPIIVLTGIGFIAMSTFLALKIRSAMFLGIVIVWIFSLLWGITEWKGFFAWPQSLEATFFQLDIIGVFDKRLLGVFLSFTFIALFDSSGALLGLAEQGNFLKSCKGKRCHFPKVSKALSCDALGSILASFLGTTTLSVYLESATGISVGGRTGLTAITVGICFLLTLFLIPFASSIPLFAAAPALIIVGGLMAQQLTKLDWKDPSEWIPGFVTFLLIPLSSNVANGIAVGFLSLSFIKLFLGKIKDLHWFSWVLSFLFLLKFIFLS